MCQHTEPIDYPNAGNKELYSILVSTVYTIREYITTYSGAVLAKAKKKQVLLILNIMPQGRVLILGGHLFIPHFLGKGQIILIIC